MPHRTRHSNTVKFAPALVIVLGLALVALALAPQVAAASEEEASEKALGQANAMALPTTYRVTLRLEAEAAAEEFSTVTAMRHFSLAPAEPRLRFRGRLWLQADGRELLEFSVDLGQEIAQKEGSAAVVSGGTWSGSTYIESGRPIEIVASPESRIRVTLTRE